MSAAESTSNQVPASGLQLSSRTDPAMSATEARAVRYTFYHPEGNGFFHVRYLGSGLQGTACLVRCAITGELFVRKRCYYVADTGDRSEADFANMIAHSNVVKCSSQYCYTIPETEQVSTVSYWPYASHLDLRNLLLTFRADRHRVPEVVIWRFLSQVTGAINAFHQRGLTHNDGHESNIFVNWNPHALLPDFLVGDLGCTSFFGPGTIDLSSWRCVDEWQAPSTENTSTTTTMPSLSALRKFDADDASLFRCSSATPYFLKEISDDFAFVVDNLTHLMSATRYEKSYSLGFGFSDPDLAFADSVRITQSSSLCANDAAATNPANHSAAQLSSLDGTAADPAHDECYSAQVHAFKKLLEQFADYVLSDDIGTYPRYQHLFNQLHDHIRDQEAQCWTNLQSVETLETLQAARSSRGRNHGRQIDVHSLKPCMCVIADNGRCNGLSVDINLPSIDERMHLGVEDEQQSQDQRWARLFCSREEHNDCGFRPPGPWSVATVDAITGQVIQLDSEVRDLRMVGCTDGQGQPVAYEPRSK